MNSDKIKEFMDRLTYMQRYKPIDSNDYSKLMKELAISHDELSRIDDLSYRHSIKAKKSEESGKIDEALIELERAVILSPFTKEWRIELFQMYLTRYQTRGYLKRDIGRAESQYKTLMEQFPNDRSIQKLKDELEKNRHIFKGKTSNVKFLPVVLGILLLVLGIAFSRRQILFPRLLSQLFSNNNTPIPEEPVINRGIPNESPVNLDTSKIPEETFSLDIATSLFKKRNGAFFYRFSGEITPQKEEISQLSLRFAWQNESGDTSYSHTYTVLEEDEAPLRPGDSQPLMETFYFKHLPENLTQASIEVASVIKAPPETYPEAADIPLTWQGHTPEGVSLKTGLRSWNYNEGYDREYYDLVWEIENTGYKELTALDAEIQWKNRDGDIIKRQQKRIIFPEGPSFSPRKRWRFQEEVSLPLGSNASGSPDIIIQEAD